MKSLIREWKEDKLYCALSLFWLATVFFSFWYQSILSIRVPSIGTISPFRVLLPITLVLYIMWEFREKTFSWKGVSAPEKWCYILIVLLLIYGASSLVRAIDFAYTLRRLMNLSIDLCFFFLMLRMCREKKMLCRTLLVVAVVLAVHSLMGVYEIFYGYKNGGGFFTDKYINYRGGYFFEEYKHYALVSYGNPNEFVSGMIMGGCALLLTACRFWDTNRQKLFRACAVGIPVLYFLIKMNNARLAELSAYCLLVGFVGFLFMTGRKQLKPFILSLVVILGISFANEYHIIVPHAEKFWTDIQTGWIELVSPEDSAVETPGTETPGTETPGTETPGTETPGTETPEKPTLSEKAEQAIALQEQQKADHMRSDLTRLQLIEHAAKGFVASKGLGVGLGNIEAQNDGGAIHCFLARMTADFGVFFLVPLISIVVLLMRETWRCFYSGVRKKDLAKIGFAWLFIWVAASYPIVSTAPADAQDLLAMWIYLATLVLSVPQENKEESAEMPQRCG